MWLPTEICKERPITDLGFSGLGRCNSTKVPCSLERWEFRVADLGGIEPLYLMEMNCANKKHHEFFCWVSLRYQTNNNLYKGRETHSKGWPEHSSYQANTLILYSSTRRCMAQIVQYPKYSRDISENPNLKNEVVTLSLFLTKFSNKPGKEDEASLSVNEPLTEQNASL